MLRRHRWGNSTGGVGALPIDEWRKKAQKILEVFLRARIANIWSKFLKSKDTSAFFDRGNKELKREYER